jgi:hypothetical protein
MAKSQTIVLKPVDKYTIKPGWYICRPITLNEDELWLTEVFYDGDLLCYKTPNHKGREAIRTVNTCGHYFFELPKRDG